MHTNDNVRDGYVKDSPENEKDESNTKTNHSGDLLLPPTEAEKMVEVICKQCQGCFLLVDVFKVKLSPFSFLMSSCHTW